MRDVGVGCIAVALGLLAACGPKGAGVDGSGGSGGSGGSSGASGQDTVDVSTATPTSGTSGAVEVTDGGTGGPTDASTGGASTGVPGCAFDVPPGVCDGSAVEEASRCTSVCFDIGGGEDPGCDLFMQDCGEGLKCTSFSTDGGVNWATNCVPVEPAPGAVGEPCTATGDAGADDCAKGAMCWNIDPVGGAGRCVAVCGCSSASPTCDAANTACVRSGDELAVCLDVCDPLSPATCGAREVCVPLGGDRPFVCHIDISGAGGALGEPCAGWNDCDAGLFCGPCFEDDCCTLPCDLDAPACPGGLECVPWYAPGHVPKCFERVGFCADF